METRGKPTQKNKWESHMQTRGKPTQKNKWKSHMETRGKPHGDSWKVYMEGKLGNQQARG